MVGDVAGKALTAAVLKPRGTPKVTPRVKAFLETLRLNPGISRTEAARRVGYSAPRVYAVRLAQKHPQLIAEAEHEALKGLKVTVEEAEQGLAAIARDPSHRDRIKALEMFLRMHGKLSDKLTVTVDRAQLNRQLDELVQAMAAARQAEALVNPLNEPHPPSEKSIAGS